MCLLLMFHQSGRFCDGSAPFYAKSRIASAAGDELN
jgi:uncharacterized protein (DUF779 family)